VAKNSQNAMGKKKLVPKVVGKKWEKNENITIIQLHFM
jgi:hypothetical protein